MRKLQEGWKSMRQPARILLVVSVIVGVMWSISFTLMIATSSGTSLSEATVNLINAVTLISTLAGAGCLLAFVLDGQRKHEAKTTMTISLPVEAADVPVVSPGDDRWAPDPFYAERLK